MNSRYLTAVEIDEIVQAAMAAGLGADATRSILLAALNHGFASGLNNVGQALFQLHADLNAMNVVERLADGSVPLREWLRRAGSLARQMAESSRRLHEVRDASGCESVRPAPPPRPERAKRGFGRQNTGRQVNRALNALSPFD